jgi:hypothetical protein
VIFASSIAILFGAYSQTSSVAAVLAAPVFAWEMSLAVWMIVKGFQRSPRLDRAGWPTELSPRLTTAGSY